MKMNGFERPGKPQLLESILYPLSFPFTKIAMGSKGINVQVNIGFFSQTFKETNVETRSPAAARLPGEQRWVGWLHLLCLAPPQLAVGDGGDPTHSNGTACPEGSGCTRDSRILWMVSAVLPLLCSLTSALSGCK